MNETLVARYDRIRELGRGAMSKVYLAEDRKLGRRVAFKELERLEDPVARERFDRECRLLSELAHPRVVAILDHGVTLGRPWLAMELFEGGTLADRLAREGPQSVLGAVRIAADCLAGLAALHARGVVHRDLKPANVLLDAAGRASLGDLGSARDLTAGQFHTATGTLVGTPLYTSPEQVKGSPATCASDIYALGLLIHEMIRGEPLFAHPDVYTVLKRHVDEIPPRLDDGFAGVPSELADVVEQMLAKDPALRPDAAALAGRFEALQSLAVTLRSGVQPVSEDPQRTAQRRREAPAPRGRWWAGALAALCLVGAAGAYRVQTRPFLPSFALAPVSDAERLLREAVAHAPQSSSAWGELADVVEKHRGMAALEQLVREAGARSPGNAAPHVALGRELSQALRLADAERELRVALELDPTCTRATIVLVEVLFATGRFREADAVARAGLTRAPKDVDLTALVGHCSIKLGDLAGGERALRGVLAVHPRNRTARDILLQVLSEQGRHRELAELAREDVRRQPASAQAHLDLARALLCLGELTGCAAELAVARGLEPENSEGTKVAGDLALVRGDAAGAESAYRLSLKHIKGDRNPVRWTNERRFALCRLIDQAIAAGCAADASKDLELLLKLSRRNADATILWMFGRHLEQGGHRSEAERCMRRALEVSPDDPLCRASLELFVAQAPRDAVDWDPLALRVRAGQPWAPH